MHINRTILQESNVHLQSKLVRTYKKMHSTKQVDQELVQVVTKMTNFSSSSVCLTEVHLKGWAGLSNCRAMCALNVPCGCGSRWLVETEREAMLGISKVHIDRDAFRFVALAFGTEILRAVLCLPGMKRVLFYFYIFYYTRTKGYFFFSDANKKLHDTNDSLREALDQRTLACKQLNLVCRT